MWEGKLFAPMTFLFDMLIFGHDFRSEYYICPAHFSLSKICGHILLGEKLKLWKYTKKEKTFSISFNGLRGVKSSHILERWHATLIKQRFTNFTASFNEVMLDASMNKITYNEKGYEKNHMCPFSSSKAHAFALIKYSSASFRYYCKDIKTYKKNDRSKGKWTNVFYLSKIYIY